MSTAVKYYPQLQNIAESQENKYSEQLYNNDRVYEHMKKVLDTWSSESQDPAQNVKQNFNRRNPIITQQSFGQPKRSMQPDYWQNDFKNDFKNDYKNDYGTNDFYKKDWHEKIDRQISGGMGRVSVSNSKDQIIKDHHFNSPFQNNRSTFGNMTQRTTSTQHKSVLSTLPQGIGIALPQLLEQGYRSDNLVSENSNTLPSIGDQNIDGNRQLHQLRELKDDKDTKLNGNHVQSNGSHQDQIKALMWEDDLQQLKKQASMQQSSNPQTRFQPNYRMGGIMEKLSPEEEGEVKRRSFSGKIMTQITSKSNSRERNSYSGNTTTNNNERVQHFGGKSSLGFYQQRDQGNRGAAMNRIKTMLQTGGGQRQNSRGNRSQNSLRGVDISEDQQYLADNMQAQRNSFNINFWKKSRRKQVTKEYKNNQVPQIIEEKQAPGFQQLAGSQQDLSTLGSSQEYGSPRVQPDQQKEVNQDAQNQDMLNSMNSDQMLQELQNSHPSLQIHNKQKPSVTAEQQSKSKQKMTPELVANQQHIMGPNMSQAEKNDTIQNDSQNNISQQDNSNAIHFYTGDSHTQIAPTQNKQQQQQQTQTANQNSSNLPKQADKSRDQVQQKSYSSNQIQNSSNTGQNSSASTPSRYSQPTLALGPVQSPVIPTPLLKPRIQTPIRNSERSMSSGQKLHFTVPRIKDFQIAQEIQRASLDSAGHNLMRSYSDTPRNLESVLQRKQILKYNPLFEVNPAQRSQPETPRENRSSPKKESQSPLKTLKLNSSSPCAYQNNPLFDSMKDLKLLDSEWNEEKGLQDMQQLIDQLSQNGDNSKQGEVESMPRDCKSRQEYEKALENALQPPEHAKAWLERRKNKEQNKQQQIQQIQDLEQSGMKQDSTTAQKNGIVLEKQFGQQLIYKERFLGDKQGVGLQIHSTNSFSKDQLNQGIEKQISLSKVIGQIEDTIHEYKLDSPRNGKHLKQKQSSSNKSDKLDKHSGSNSTQSKSHTNQEQIVQETQFGELGLQSHGLQTEFKNQSGHIIYSLQMDKVKLLNERNKKQAKTLSKVLPQLRDLTQQAMIMYYLDHQYYLVQEDFQEMQTVK